MLAELGSAFEKFSEAEKKAQVAAAASEHEESDVEATPATKKAKAAMRKKLKADAEKAAVKAAVAEVKGA